MRYAPRLLAVVLFALVGVTTIARSSITTHAQDQTPAASPVAVSPLLQQWVDAVNASDGDAVAALYAEDGVHEDVPAGMVVQGRDQIAALVNGTVSQFRDLHWTVERAHQGEDFATLEYSFAATDLESDQPLQFRGVVIFELADDRIQHSTDYYDVATILGQLGLLPGMEEGTPEATPTA